MTTIFSTSEDFFVVHNNGFFRTCKGQNSTPKETFRPTPFEEVTAFMIVEMGGYSHPLFIPALYDVVFFLYDLYNLLDP